MLNYLLNMISITLQGLQPDDYPPELTEFDSAMDAQSLFWKARRVQALVMQARGLSCQ